MKNIKLLFISLFIITYFFSCSSDDDDITENQVSENLDATKIYEELNVSYGDDEDQKFDIYLPANRTLDTKFIVLIHGGSWVQGDKEDMSEFVGIIQNEFDNLGIININYRLASQGNPPFPMQTDDITTIINLLKEKQEFYTISDEFGFIGASAGAQLSMLWSYSLDSNSKSKMVCSIVGPTNFTDPSYDAAEFALINAGFTLLFGEPTDAYLESVSPFHVVTTDAPPTILFYGDQDELVPVSQGVELKAKLDALNITNNFTLYEGQGHGWEGEDAIDTANQINAFIGTHMFN